MGAEKVKQATPVILNPYLIAVDQASKPEQREIMTQISRALGNGQVREFQLADVIDEPWSEFLIVDLKMKTSPMFL